MQTLFPVQWAFSQTPRYPGSPHGVILATLKKDIFTVFSLSVYYLSTSYHYPSPPLSFRPSLLNPSQEWAYASWVTELLSRTPPIVAIDLEDPLQSVPCWNPSFIMYTDRDYSVENHHEGGSPPFTSIERQCEHLEPSDGEDPFTEQQVEAIRRESHDSLSDAQLHQKTRLLHRIRWDTHTKLLGKKPCFLGR